MQPWNLLGYYESLITLTMSRPNYSIWRILIVIAAYGTEIVWSQRIDGIQSKFEKSPQKTNLLFRVKYRTYVKSK